LQPLKGDKQRSGIEAENALAHLFEPNSDPISMHGLERQRFQNKHVQCALDEITRLVRHRRIPPEDQEEEYISPKRRGQPNLRTNVWHQKPTLLHSGVYEVAFSRFCFQKIPASCKC